MRNPVLFAFMVLPCLVVAQCVNPEQINLNIMCPAIYDPVCGCNGVTYSNACEAVNHGGVTSHVPGTCEVSGCLQIPEGVTFGMCEMFLGYAMTSGGCSSFSGCGTVGSNNVDYAAYFQPTPEICAAVCTGCVDPSQINLKTICPMIYDPVCGCDGITYGNSCEAINWGGVTSYTPGVCQEVVEPCFDVGWVDFGDCDMALGWAYTGNGCESVSGCGWVAGGFDFSPFFFEDEEACEASCATFVPQCVDPEWIDGGMACIALWDPVCGCDNVTYSNSCVAFFQHGVTSWQPGECGTGVREADAIPFEAFPVPMTDVLHLRVNASGQYKATLYDGSGKFLMQYPLTGFVMRRISLEGMGDGVYYLVIAGEDGRVSRRKLIRTGH